MQAFADLITINEYKKTVCPKVVMSWAPHPKALPQAVPNSFAEWILAAGYELVITQPHGYELDSAITKGAKIEYDQEKAFKGADFIYGKNWSAYEDQNYGKVICTDRDWTIDSRKMALTNNAYFMHCLPVRRNMKLCIKNSSLFSLSCSSNNGAVILWQYALNQTLQASFLFLGINFLGYAHFLCKRKQYNISSGN